MIKMKKLMLAHHQKKSAPISSETKTPMCQESEKNRKKVALLPIFPNKMVSLSAKIIDTLNCSNENELNFPWGALFKRTNRSLKRFPLNNFKYF
jgi:hypothetical protein